MRSPEPLVFLRWQLHPRPTGRRRFAAAYLTALSATAISSVIISLAHLMSTSCSTQGIACLSVYFRGIGIGVVAGVGALLAGTIMLKLGGRFFLVLAASIPLVALIAALLHATPLAWPAMIIFASAVPAAATWLSEKLA
jgi:hypothetical protein